MSGSHNAPERYGLWLILSSPSGAGKTTVARMLLEREVKLQLSISLTTRPSRAGEVDGVDYNFISKSKFEQMRTSDSLLEWAEVHGNYYATPKTPATEAIKHGVDVLFDIDWQGAKQITALHPTNVVRIFLLPPTGKALANRLHRRALDDHSVIQKRLKNTLTELGHFSDYDYVLVNHEGAAESTCLQVQQILTAERLRLSRRRGIQERIEQIKTDLEQVGE